MKTEVSLVNGKKLIIKGSPQDYMQIVQGLGATQNEMLTCIKGEKFKFEDVVTMQQVKE